MKLLTKFERNTKKDTESITNVIRDVNSVKAKHNNVKNFITDMVHGVIKNLLEK